MADNNQNSNSNNNNNSILDDPTVQKQLEAANIDRKDAEEMLRYSWIVAKAVKGGFDGLPTLLYQDAWKGNFPGMEWDGWADKQYYDDMMRILIKKAKIVDYTPVGTPIYELPQPTVEDFADVLEMYADQLPVEVLEMAFSQAAPVVKGLVAFGKAGMGMMIKTNPGVKRDLTYNTAEVALACLSACSNMEKYRDEMLPVYQLVSTHPRLLAWVCKFIRRFFRLEQDYLNGPPPPPAAPRGSSTS